MTMKQSTGCTLIQGFPLLLILAQKYNKCLTTPFEYHPPKPTPSPEYYEALDALYHTLFGQGYDLTNIHGFNTGHHGYPSYPGIGTEYHGYGTGYHGYGTGHDGYGTGYHGYGTGHHEYGTGHHGSTGNKYPDYGSTNKYPVYGSHGTKPYIPLNPHGHPIYPGYAVKRVYNYTNVKGHKMYAPSQTYNIQNKYKVVVRKNKRGRRGHKRRLEKLRGFFPQRDERRYTFQQGFNNLLTAPKRITERLTGILHIRPETQNSNTAFIYPFRRPGIATNDEQSNNYPYQNGQNYNYNQGGYGFQNANPGYGYNQGYQNYGYNNPVAFPTMRPNGPAVDFVNNNEGQPETNLDTNNNVGTAVNFVDNSNGQYTESNPGNDKTSVNFVDNSNGQYTETNPSNNNNQNEPPRDESNQNANGEDVQEGKDNDSNVSFGETETGFNNRPSTSNGISNVPPSGIPSQPPSGIPDAPPAGIPDSPPTFAPQLGLQALTPVPDTEKRNNFNFGPAGLFQETCQTIDQNIGSCISILQCQPYLKVLKSSQTNPQAVQILRRAHCGFEGNNPKVCCPLPGIPTGPPTAPPTTTTTTTTTTTVAPQNPDPQAPTDLAPEDRVGAFLDPPVCGYSNASFSRVVGGVKAKLADFPWMALLGYKRGTSTRWLCGGSLISSKHVLTAAHCIHGHEPDLYLVRLGELDLEREDEGATPVDVLIKYKIKHEQYSPTAFTNDIGILVLDKEMTFTDLIKPICIPKDNELRARSFENYTPIIAGWGDTEFRGPSASHLQALQLPVVSNDFCADAYKSYKNQKIDERVLCAGYREGGKDACQGDSGGPLMQPIWNTQDYTTHFYQIGVVSFGRKCAEAGFPGVYTRVTHFVPWLEQTIIGA